ncbi:MAG TPA: zinc metallopeptidase [Candidatus Limnocylindria bacterium]|jgi:Zn-dependent membrane protease YugP|nr:zinc metallopeptidase [Candidatus Limnocylindria bacterium]
MFGGSFWIYVLVVMLPSVALTGWAAWRVRSTYAKWSKVDSGIRLSAFDFARQLLDRQGLRDVRIEPVEGQLTDHYDPRGKVLRVSSTVAGQPQLGNYDPQAQMLGVPVPANGLSVAAAAVIAHEVGHALQDRDRDPWMAVRQTIVPAVQLGSGLGPWLIIGGLILNLLSLAYVGLIFFAAAVLFTFVTLPVEIGASGKALAFVSSLGMVGERQTGARDVLKAAAWTYVAAALTALLTFLYYLMLIMGRRD